MKNNTFEDHWKNQPCWKEGATDKDKALYYYRLGLIYKRGPMAKSPAAMAGSVTISKGEWLKRCAARFVEVADLSEEFAEQLAEDCLKSTIEFGDIESTPEKCADEELSYWSD